MILAIPRILMYILDVDIEDILEAEALAVSTIIYAISLIIGMAIELDINRKIKKMYKEYSNGKEFNEKQKGIIIVPLIILAACGALITSDFAYSSITDDRPILSIKDEKESNKYKEKYKAIFYDYYKDNEDIAYMRLKDSEFKRDYAERITIFKYITNFNNNLKIANIDKEIDLYDYIYIDGEYIWILEENLELRLEIEEGKIDHRDIKEKGDVRLASLICFDKKFNENKFDNYAKVLIKSDTQWYSNEDIDNIYIETKKEKYEKEGICYYFNNKNNKIFMSARVLKNSEYSEETYVHTSLNNFLQVTLPNNYIGIEEKGDKYELYCTNKETGAEIFANYYVKDKEEYFHMTEEDAINIMVKECSKNFKDIKKISEINTVLINNKEIKEVVYTGKYGEKQIVYKISGFKTGKTNQYMVGVCYLINENLYQEKKKELDNIRNSIRDEAGNVYVGVKVKNEEAVYKNVKVDDLFSINVPKSFNKLNKEEISGVRWQSINNPESVYTKPNFTTYMAVQIEKLEEDFDLEELVEALAYKTYSTGSILGKEIVEINGNNIGVVKGILENEIEERYYHLIIFKIQNKNIVIGISTRRDLMSQWNWVAEEMMESIKF